ncbi:MAG: hypothetical protein ACO3EZ_17885 [Prochlorotrichaceae cyanobacterium]
MILINCPIAPPSDLLASAIQTGNTEPLAEWFIGQKNPGYSFETIAQFVAEERSKISKPKAKRAPSGQSKARKASTPTKQKAEAKSL